MTAHSDQRWRDKYLALLEQQEVSSEQLLALRRAMQMLLVLAQGQPPELDRSLEDLRQYFKDDSQWQSASRWPEQLEQAIRRFNLDEELQLQQLQEHSQYCFQQLLEQKPAIAQRRQIKQLQRLMASMSGPAGQRQLIIAWAELAVGLQQPPPSRSGGVLDLLGQWLQPRAEPSPSAPRPDVEPGFSHIAREVTASLQGLLQRLVIPLDWQSRAGQLQKQLQQQLNWYELVPILEQTSGLVMACIEGGQQGMEHFLQQLDLHLQHLQQLLMDSGSDGQQHREQLSLLLHTGVEDIRSLVTGGGNLAAMGASVQSQLQAIMAAMSQFNEQEQARELALQQQMQQLQQRLSQLEQESRVARQQLQRQRYQAHHDALTGLPNRAAWQARIQQEWIRLQQGCELVLAVADIDHFKRFNDTWGHRTGDRVLQLVARTLRQRLQADAFVGRYGGEEFVILLAGQSLNAALVALESLRESIAKVPWHFQGQPVTVTLSFGVAMALREDTPAQLFERADRALYQAKQQGRNRIVAAAAEQP